MYTDFIYYVNLRNATIILYLAFKLPKLRKLMKITKITKSHENYHYTIIFAEIDKNLIMYLIVILPLIKKVERKNYFHAKLLSIHEFVLSFFLIL